ncbi:uncharacterized protein LOC143052027 [Mytilus galloprovincialis]|uniref:uncharacterized protein LOC143052027 n=1 Tax=Mytilus galloprovincialis TaxID=29158 RepID=UPI003F7C6073
MASLSEEEENYVRLALLLKGVTPRAFRTYFDREFLPTTLHSTLSTRHSTLFDLKSKRILNQVQWNLLKNGVPDSKTFDVTLMICLIRNLTSIIPPINGFDSLPLLVETTPGSDLARIKCYRNKLAHHDSNTIDTTYFETAWIDISDAVGRLGGKTMYRECQELKVKILDQSNQEIILEIQQSLEEIKELRQIMDNLGTEHAKVTENLRELQTSHCTLKAEHSKVKEVLNDPIPQNIREQIQFQIQDWEKKDKMFVSTRANDYVFDCLHDNSCLTLTGPPGVGKSFIARHTVLCLQKDGYNIIPVRKPDDIADYYQPGKKTVFIVDDLHWGKADDRNCIHGHPKMSDEKLDKLCLTAVEKNIMANAYIGASLDNIDKLSQSSDIFPLLCSLYHWEKHGDVMKFFKNPFIIYQNELDSLSRCGTEGKYKVCSLALLVLLNNQVTEKWFKGKVTEEQRHILEDTCEACRLNRSTSKSELYEALLTLDGTFVQNQYGIYRTVHDKLFDFLAYYFGQKMMECLINHGDSDFVHERFIWRKSTDDRDSNIEFIIQIPYDYLELYLERFIKDWSTGRVRVTLMNNNLTVSEFRQQLLKHLQLLDKSLQVTLANKCDTVLSKEHHGSGTTPLIQTCFAGYTDMVQWMLHNDVDVNQCRDNGVTGLYFASQNGHTEIVKLLLERNPNIYLCQKDGCSPLFIASQNGNTEIVKLLLELNPNIDLCNNNGCSPLYMASQNGHTEIVKLLLERNPNIDLCRNDGCSPLRMASYNGHTDIVRLLLERNPNIDLCNNDGCSPLHMASQNGHTEIVRLLLERNPNNDLCSKRTGCSPLFYASHNGHIEVVKLLLERNPIVDLCDKNGCSPLYLASQKGHTEIVKMLLEKKPNIDLCANNGCSPLRQASRYGHTEIVKLLIEKNANIDLCNNTGCSPLYMASQEGHTDILKLLLEMNPNVDLCDNKGRSPLYIASLVGHTDIMWLLLDIGGIGIYYVDFTEINGL